MPRSSASEQCRRTGGVVIGSVVHPAIPDPEMIEVGRNDNRHFGIALTGHHAHHIRGGD